jgi:hypothetical protein
MTSTPRVPEPALIRSALVAITAIVAVIVGRNVDTSWVDNAVAVYAALSALVAGIAIRPAVTPVSSLPPTPPTT